MPDAPATSPGPREWVGEAPFPWPSVHALEVGDSLVACYCVLEAQVAPTKAGKPYLRLRLSDRHGPVEARAWDDAERLGSLVASGVFVGVRARIEEFKGERQLRLETLVPLRVAPEEMGLFLPRSRRDPEAMDAELGTWIASVDDPGLRTLLEALLGPGTETGRAFRVAPAAKRHHHASVGGLLEHTLSLTGVCNRLAEHYGGVVDRDLLIAGALLHDIGKIREISVQAGFPYTDEGKLLGHIVLGIGMVEAAAREVEALGEERRTLLLHLIAAHQGRYEWQSPREPLILEALLLHYADDLDAKVAEALRLLRTVEGGWTAYDRLLGRSMLRHGGGEVGGGERDDEAGDSPEPPAPETLPLFE